MSRRLLKHPLGWLATGFGSGLAPSAPGTVGSMVALAPAWVLCSHPEFAWPCLALLIVLGVWSGGWANRQLGTHDGGCIVVDEWAGQWLTLFPSASLLPQFFAQDSKQALVFVAGLLLFRWFDILKPWPASWADQHVHGGIGVMLDDLLAAVWSALALLALLYFAPAWFV